MFALNRCEPAVVSPHTGRKRADGAESTSVRESLKPVLAATSRLWLSNQTLFQSPCRLQYARAEISFEASTLNTASGAPSTGKYWRWVWPSA